MWERMHGWIPLPCKNAHTNSFHGPPVNTHAGKESVQSLLWKYPLILSFSHKHSPHLLYSPLTHTLIIYYLHFFLEQPFSFPKQACLLSGQRVSLSSIFLDQSVQVAVSAISYFCPSIQRFPSGLWPPPTTPPLPFPSVWTRLAPGNKQRRVCVRGGRDVVSLSEGTMLLLVALHLKLLLSPCLSLW